MERPTLPAPAMATRIEVLRLVVIAVAAGRPGRPRPWPARGPAPPRTPGPRPGRSCSTSGTMPLPIRNTNGTRAPVAVLDLLHGPAHPGPVDVHLHQPDRPRRVAPLRLRAGRQQPAQHLVGRPAHGGHGGDAEPLVHLGPAGVVDPGDHVLDAEGLPDHPGGEDVGVVAGGDRGEPLGLLDAGLQQHLAVEAHPRPSCRRSPGRGGGTPRHRWSITATVCPRFSRLRARVEPTRPQPMITMCTIRSLVTWALARDPQ